MAAVTFGGGTFFPRSGTDGAKSKKKQ